MSAVREAYGELQSADIQAWGISDGTARSHARFREHLALPFELLVDTDLNVARVYDALKPDPVNPGQTLPRIQRTVYIIGKDGRVIYCQRGAPLPSEMIAVVSVARDDP